MESTIRKSYIDNGKKYMFTDLQYFAIMGYYESLMIKDRYYINYGGMTDTFSLNKINIDHLRRFAKSYVKTRNLYRV